MKERLLKAWHDPVGSKVIATGFVGLLSFIGVTIYTHTKDISYGQYLSEVWGYITAQHHLNFSLLSVVIGIVIIFLLWFTFVREGKLMLRVYKKIFSEFLRFIRRIYSFKSLVEESTREIEQEKKDPLNLFNGEVPVISQEEIWVEEYIEFKKHPMFKYIDNIIRLAHNPIYYHTTNEAALNYYKAVGIIEGRHPTSTDVFQLTNKGQVFYKIRSIEAVDGDFK